MDVQIRPLRPEDIGRVVQIERQAFPTLWPPTPFDRELHNRRARYLVAWLPKPAASPQIERETYREAVGVAGAGLFSRLLGGLKGSLSGSRGNGLGDPIEPGVGGFLGLWFMVDEAHIISIAVSETWRGKGSGELLVMSSLELAMNREASVLSLEARVSNHVALSLYQKYGFEKVGIRKAYYSDNREDAAIMTTQPINTEAYRARFQTLREEYRRRHGEFTIELP
jgi:ribosomal-protein-alanine N-acetyltransferase